MSRNVGVLGLRLLEGRDVVDIALSKQIREAKIIKDFASVDFVCWAPKDEDSNQGRAPLCRQTSAVFVGYGCFQINHTRLILSCKASWKLDSNEQQP